MAAAAIATPPQLPSFSEPTLEVNSPSIRDLHATYEDPRSAPKTKASQGYPLSAGLIPKAPGPNQLYKQKGVRYGDWRDDLVRDGFVVVKSVIPKERALAYGDGVFDYLESLSVFPTHAMNNILAHYLAADFTGKPHRRFQTRRHQHGLGEKSAGNE